MPDEFNFEPLNKPQACSFCYTGSEGCADVGPTPRLVVAILREGPYAIPTHAICDECFGKSKHLRRPRCCSCGKLSSLLRTAHHSMTNTWVQVGDIGLLCDECQKTRYDYEKNRWTAFKPMVAWDEYTILSDDDIELLKRLWKLPNWKTRTKMPVLRRRIDD